MVFKKICELCKGKTKWLILNPLRKEVKTCLQSEEQIQNQNYLFVVFCFMQDTDIVCRQIKCQGTQIYG